MRLLLLVGLALAGCGPKILHVRYIIPACPTLQEDPIPLQPDQVPLHELPPLVKL